MPADTYDSILGLLLQATGNNNNNWGALQNTGIFELIAQAIAGRASHAVTGGTLTLDDTKPPTGPTEAMHMVQAFTGTLGSNQVVQVPNLSKLWLVDNQCTLGAYTLKFKTSGGSASAAIPVGKCLVWCDGSDAISVGLSTSLRDVQWLGADGAVGAPGLSFESDPDSGIRRKGANNLCIVVNGADIIEITTAGATVTGDLTVSGALSAANVPSTGDLKLTLKATADSGWVMWDDGTIGNASSNSTTRAHADTSSLFALIWDNISNSNAPVYNSDGTSSTRGASAAIDYAANKRIRLPLLRGRAIALAGAGASLTSRSLGDSVGAETHTLSEAELPSLTKTTSSSGSHYHVITASGGSRYGMNSINPGTSWYGSSGDSSNGGTATVNSDTASAHTHTVSFGGGGSHNNMQPTGFLNLMIKL